MNEIQFAYWLQGYFELSNSNTLTEEQVKIIKEHLALVFIKVTGESETPFDSKKFLDTYFSHYDTGTRLC